MKNRNILAVATVLAGISLNAQAAPFSLAELNSATAAATADFEANHRSHMAHFTGYKTWKSGESAKVKIYVDHGGMNMDVNYTCYRTNAGVACRE